MDVWMHACRYGCMHVWMYACMYVCMYASACTDAGCYVAVPPSYLHRSLLPRYRIFSGTCTDSWCYVTSPSIPHAQTVDATLQEVTKSSLLLPYTWCYVTRSCLVRAQTLHVACQDLFYTRRHLMVSERIFSCTCTDTWCHINRPSLVLAQTLEVIRSSLVLAHLHRRLGLVLR